MAGVLDNLLKKKDEIKRKLRERTQQKNVGTYQEGDRPAIRELKMRLRDLQSRIERRK